MCSLKNIGKKATLFVLFLLSFFVTDAQSSMGKDLEYVYLGTSGGTNQYKVTVRLFWNCWDYVNGVANNAPPTSVTLKAVGCAVNTSFVLNEDHITSGDGGSWGGHLTSLCPEQLDYSACIWTDDGNAGPPLYQSAKVYFYSATISLPTGCSQIYLGIDDCCRSADVANIINPPSSSAAILAVVNTNVLNSSVHFMGYFREVFVCQNSVANLNYGGTDSDGDSLVYSLVTPLQGTVPPYANATFNAGFSESNPVQTNGVFGFNSTNGQMTFVPSILEQDVIAVRADEYRNGILVGSTMREITLGINNCFASNPVFHSLEVQNATLTSPTSISICPNTAATIRVLITAANHGLQWNVNNFNASPEIRDSLHVTYSGNLTDSLYVTIQWTPTLADTGCHWIFLRIQNTDCPVRGMTSQEFQICVEKKVTVSPHSALYCGTPVRLTASGGNNFLWTPTVNTVNTNTRTPLVYPNLSTRYTFSSDCGIDTARVVPVNIFQADAGEGGTICRGGQLPLQALTDNVYPSYRIHWFPSEGLSNDTVLNPVASPLSTTTYTAVLTAPNGCSRQDTVTVYVSGGVSPAIHIAAIPDSVCPGEPVTLIASMGAAVCGSPMQTCTGQQLTALLSANPSVQTGLATDYPSPYGNYYASARHQYLIKAQELRAAIGEAGGQIKNFAMNVAVLNSNNALQNFTIKMGCTSLDSLTSYQENLLTVFTPKNVTPVAGWNTHNFDTYYDWDGKSNLVIDVCFSNATGGSMNNKMQVNATSYRSQLFTWSNTMSMCGVSGAQPQIPAFSAYFSRPTFQFNVCLFDLSNTSFQWTPNAGANAPTPQNNDSTIAHPLVPINYSIAVTAANGCTSQGIRRVVVDTSIRFTVLPDTVLCRGQSVQLHARAQGSPVAPDFTYAWSASSGVVPASGTGSAFANPVVTPAQTTTYICTVIGGQCSLVDSVKVSIAPDLAPSIIQTDSVFCFGAATGRLRAVAGSGIAPYSYAWSPNVSADSAAFSLFAGIYNITITDSHFCTGTASKQISQPTQLTVNISELSPVLCYGGSSGSLRADASGGIPLYTYSWSNGGVTMNPNTGLQSGTYRVTVRDSKLCQATASALLTQPIELQATIVQTDSAICFGTNTGRAIVSATGGAGSYSYAWSAGSSTTTTNTNLPAGANYVYVTDGNLCKDTTAFIIYQPAQLQMNIFSTPASCDQSNDGVITTNVWGGVSPYFYRWDGVSGASSHSGLSTGLHTVVVTDANNCSLSRTATIDTLYRLRLSMYTSPTTCFGSSDGIAMVVPTNGSPNYQYVWSVSGSGSIVNASAGEVSVSVTDVNNCSASATATILQPSQITVTTASQMPTCVGANNGFAWARASGGTPDYVYAWSTFVNTDTAQNLSSGIYNITVYDASFCSAVSSVLVGIPNSLHASVSKTNIRCFDSNDGTATVSVAGGTAPYSYVWDNADTVAHRINLAPATYQVSVSDANGCDTVLQVSFTNPTPVSFVSVITDSVKCPRSLDGRISVSMTGGTSPYSYSLDSAAYQGSPVFNSVGTGTYRLNVRDANGCMIDTMVAVIGVPELEFEIQPQDTTIERGEKVVLSVFTNNYPTYWFNSYLWTPSEGLSCDDCLSPTFWGYIDGTYTLTINYGKNCTFSDTVTIKVQDHTSVYIPNAFSPNGKGWIENETIRVFGREVDSVEFRIYDRWGEKVFEANPNQQAWDGTYKGEKQPPGVYVYDAVIYYLTGKIEYKKGSILLIR